MESVAMMLVAGALMVIGGTWLAPKIRMAAPILLVLVGIACSLIPGQAPLEIEPEWILTVVLPPILYAAAVNVPMTDFRRNFLTISGLSVGLVLFSAVAVGFLLSWLLPGLPLAAGIALGAVVAPPDAVAATSIGKRLGLPARLVSVLEGEGLVNDATALVLLRSAIAALAGGVTLLDVTLDFDYAVLVGIGIGTVVGFVAVRVRARIGQPTLTTAISFTVPFLAFLPTEALHASGVLAVVVAGLITGFTATRHLTPQDRISERMNWRTIQLMLENGVFLAMGYQLLHVAEEVTREGGDLWGTIWVGLAVTAALILVRILFAGPLSVWLRFEQRRATRRLADTGHVKSARWRHVLRLPHGGKGSQRRRADWRVLAEEGIGGRGTIVIAWAGMRGVVTVAAAQTLPLGVPFRAELVLIAFTVAMTTLLLHGTTLPALIRVLRITGPDEATRRREMQQLIDQIVASAAERVRTADLRSTDGTPVDPDLIADMLQRRLDVSKEFWELRLAEPRTAVGQRAALFDAILHAEQEALARARTSGHYSSEALALAQTVLDTEQARSIHNGTIE